MVLLPNIPLEKPTAVQLKTILNHVERHKSFVYQDARWADPATKTQIEIPIEPPGATGTKRNCVPAASDATP